MYNKSANQYQKVGIASEIEGADPHRLIQMLMEGALTRMSQAKGFIEREDHEAKAAVLGRVVEIIATLQSSLDHNQGGEIAGELERLYDYMNRRIIDAMSNNDVDILDEVMGLMLQIKSGWDGIREEYLMANGLKTSTSSEARDGVKHEFSV